jgi:hypothetical protein
LTWRRDKPYSYQNVVFAENLIVAKKKRARRQESELVGFVGLGLDAADGHKRLTRSENFILIGGSEKTHERMQDTALRFDECLKKRGKNLREASPEEAIEVLREALKR